MSTKNNNKIEQKYSKAEVEEILNQGKKYDQAESFLNDMSDAWSFPSNLFLDLVAKSTTNKNK